MRTSVAGALFFVGVVGAATGVTAQELEPRAYSPSPVGVNFVALVAGHSSGDIVVDPSLPIEDASARVDTLAIGVGKTLNVFGRTGLFVAALPWAWADATGRVGLINGHITRRGVADPRIKMSVNIVGGRAMDAREFARTRRSTIIGVSLAVVPPLGQYDRTKLINLGANRWSFKPEIGVSRFLHRWTVEGYVGTWLFTGNDQFYTGTFLRTQEPIVALQGHASYTFRPQFWVALDGTWFSGGTTTVAGEVKADLQRNSRLGATISLPLGQRQSLKISGSGGTTTRIGADFRTIAAAWQLTWFDR